MRPIEWRGDHASLIDQTRLPLAQEWIECRTLADYADAIKSMKIRGAPAIGITAAYGLAQVALDSNGKTTAELIGELEGAHKVLGATRPTAVNLFWALDRVLEAARQAGDDPVTVRKCVVDEALAIHREDEDMCRRIGGYGAELVDPNSRILTHCNAGALATGDYGTALGVVRRSHELGRVQWVWVDETRPFLQGSRLTAWELTQDNIPCRLVCDNMAAHLMQRGLVDLVVVGADRITANGDVANKIGTYGLAVLCKEHRIPFYVAAPSSTIDMKLKSGYDIPIEERAADEVRHLHGQPIAPPEIEVANPAFDMTPASYISAIITEKGILRAPYEESLQAMFLTPA